MKFLYDPPNIVKSIFKRIIWNSNDGVVLTFDDGPIPYVTETVLDTLDNIEAKAIFFTVGDNIKKYPNIAHEIIKRGHLIGNHTVDHSKTSLLEPYKVQRRKIELSQKIIQDVCGVDCKLYRPPHGRFNFTTQKIVDELGMEIMLWSCLTYDYSGKLESRGNKVEIFK